MILERVPQVLQNKALILSRDAKDIDYFASTLCALVGLPFWKKKALLYFIFTYILDALLYLLGQFCSMYIQKC